MDDFGVCIVCGKEFYRDKYQHTKRLCSDECRDIRVKYYREISKERAKLNNKKEPKKKRKMRVASRKDWC